MTNLDPMRMGTRLARNWWTVALRGAIAIIFGLAALFWPDITLTALIFIFAAFVLVSGVLLAIAAFRDGLTHTHGWLMLLEGAIGIAIGIMAFIWPGITALVLLYIIAAWAIVTGVLEIIAAIQVRKEIQNEWLLAISRHCVGIVRRFTHRLAYCWCVSNSVDYWCLRHYFRYLTSDSGFSPSYLGN